jgi:hypothetical protein
MKVTGLKSIMKEVNEPNEFILEPFDLLHPYYWIFTIKGVRVKTLFSKLEPLRIPSARFDVFINGLFIRDIDYVFEMVNNDFYIKFKRENFPEFDRFGDPYTIGDEDEIKINGDIEKFI